MSPAEITAMIKILQSLTSTLNSIGLPGLISIILLGPTCILALFMYMNHQATIRAEKAQDLFIKSNNELLESYRNDTSRIVHEIGERHNAALKLHENTMGKLRSSEQHNAVLHTIVINNTTAMEQLRSVVRTILKERA